MAFLRPVADPPQEDLQKSRRGNVGGARSCLSAGQQIEQLVIRGMPAAQRNEQRNTEAERSSSGPVSRRQRRLGRTTLAVDGKGGTSNDWIVFSSDWVEHIDRLPEKWQITEVPAVRGGEP